MKFVLVLLVFITIGLTVVGRAQPLAPGGGPTLGWFPLGSVELNEQLDRADLPQLQPGMLLLGASYFGERRERLAVGGLTAFGQSGASRLDKSVKLSLLSTGLALEYGELVTERWGIFVGGSVAPTQLALEVTLQPAADFRSGLEKPSGTSLTREFFCLELYAGGEWAFGAQRFRLSLGYLWAGAVTNWRADGRDLPGPGESFSGPLIQAVLVIGI